MEQNEIIEENTTIEREPGFINAEGNNGLSYASANQAYYAYLDATGQKKTKANKGKFKAWLTKAKESGQLDKVVSGAKQVAATAKTHSDNLKVKADATANAAIEEEKKENLPDTTKKAEFKIPMIAKIGIVVAAIGLVSWGVYVWHKKSQAKQG